MNRVGVVLGVAIWAGLWSGAAAAEAPRLVVVLVVDQFRPDYLNRSAKWLLPARDGDRRGGFRLLMDEGAAYWNASYSHLATFTCAGHATILSGSEPALSGIISNTWFDREAGVRVGCVDDLNAGPTGARRSPRTMMVSTVGDELKSSNQGRSKVIGMAAKDYAAIVLAGRRSDLTLWIDNQGRWVSNSYYTGDQGVPDWVRRLNDQKIPDSYAGKAWTRLLPAEAYADCDPTPFFAETVNPEVGVSSELGPWAYGWKFPHLIASSPPNPLFYASFNASGFANDFMVESAKRAVEGEELGEDDAPDILALSFSSNDKAGHFFGPNSPEALDMTVRTDRALSELFTYLDKRIGLDKVVVVLTSDHGVQEIPEELRQNKAPAGRIKFETLVEAVEAALDKRFGRADWVRDLTDLDLYLNTATLEKKSVDRAEVERVASRALTTVEGVYWAVGRSDILEGRLPQTDWAQRVYRTYNPQRSGDVIILYQPDYFRGELIITTHGTHYPANAHVPVLLYGHDITAGAYYRPVDPKDIAPTLSQLLGIVYPNGCTGQPLVEALAGFKP